LDNVSKHEVTYWDKKSKLSKQHNLIIEEPLSIRVQGKPYSVVMRTPGDEIQHVAGFCLGEGIIDTPDDFESIAFCDGEDTNVVTVTLKKFRRDKISHLLERRGFISQTSCGICGKEVVNDLYQIIKPLEDDTLMDIKEAFNRLEQLSMHQPLRDKTRASHAAVLYSSDFELLSVAEDVGRHNALDKSIGKVFLDRKLQNVSLLILSSRISYELVQKAARARIPVILAMSRPTSLAVELASRLNITLACLANESGLYIFCAPHRLL